MHSPSPSHCIALHYSLFVYHQTVVSRIEEILKGSLRQAAARADRRARLSICLITTSTHMCLEKYINYLTIVKLSTSK